eukprot:6168758-Pleurochrysis_carterae.AAC.1
MPSRAWRSCPLVIQWRSWTSGCFVNSRAICIATVTTLPANACSAESRAGASGPRQSPYARKRGSIVSSSLMA